MTRDLLTRTRSRVRRRPGCTGPRYAAVAGTAARVRHRVDAWLSDVDLPALGIAVLVGGIVAAVVVAACVVLYWALVALVMAGG